MNWAFLLLIDERKTYGLWRYLTPIMQLTAPQPLLLSGQTWDFRDPPAENHQVKIHCFPHVRIFQHTKYKWPAVEGNPVRSMRTMRTYGSEEPANCQEDVYQFQLHLRVPTSLSYHPEQPLSSFRLLDHLRNSSGCSGMML